ncbi:MAG: class I SAM-dependent methyltransferase [Planctomycetaceae bacterium]|nr:class I SAM-dependent methyltransferase [Planctomycetaceae bacterium]
MASHSTLYRDDLAFIHVDGYGFHWAGAADAILDWLRQFKLESGRVVDLGCGGGQWLARLEEEGYETCGIDVSEHMIQIAKQNSPRSEFLCGSFADIAIPECDAVTSLGEPMNYLNSGPAMRRTMRNVYSALRSGGVFVFDVRHPASRKLSSQVHKTTENWFCHALIEEDHEKNQLKRYITTFRQTKDETYRRDEETHRLKVFSRSDVVGWLRKIGFRVRTRRSYGSYKLGERQSVFICRKP